MKTRQLLIKPLFWLCWMASFFVSFRYLALDSVTVWFLAISAVSFVFTQSGEGKRLAAGYGSKRKQAALWMVAAYLCFALFGRNLFLYHARMIFTPMTFIGYLILTAALYPIAPGVIMALEKIRSSSVWSPAADKKAVLAGAACSLIVAAGDIILSLGYYPGTFTEDSATHWRQAAGLQEMTDYSPMVYNLLLKGLFSITGYRSSYIYCLFQILLFAVVIGNIAGYLRLRGLPLKTLLIGSFVIAVVPSSYLLMLYLSKNPMTTILNLWVAVSLIELITDHERYVRSVIWHIKTIAAITLLMLIRQNNIAVAIPLICFFIWMWIRSKENRKQILCFLGVLICVIGLVQGAAVSMMEYTHADKSHETVRPLLAPVGSALQQELPLSEDIVEKAEKILPVEEWKKRYDSFHSDDLTWVDPRPDYSKVTTGEAFGIYFKMLFTYPDVVVKDRLDATNLIWDLRGEEFLCPFFTYDHYGIELKKAELSDDQTICRITEIIGNVSGVIYKVSCEMDIIELVVWKNGIYIYLLLITVIFLWKNKKVRLLWAIAPSVFILLTYVLVIAWQMYFYVAFFPAAVILLMIAAAVECGGKKTLLEDAV